MRFFIYMFLLSSLIISCTKKEVVPMLVLEDTPTVADTLRATKPEFRTYLKKAVNKALILGQTVEIYGPLKTYSIRVTPVADWKSEQENVGCRKLRIQIWRRGVLEQDGYALGCRPYKVPLVVPEEKKKESDGIWSDFPIIRF